jgi:hypothetical protein
MIITILQNRCLEEDRESEAWKAVGFEGREGIFKDNPEKGWKPEFINEFSPIATKEITPSKENRFMPLLNVCEMVFAEFQGQENTNPEWNIIEKSHRSLSVGDIVKLEGELSFQVKFFMVEGCGFSEFAPEEIAEDSSPDNGGDDRDAKIDAMQKQIDSLRAMVLSNQSHCKKTHMSAYQASKESLKELKQRIGELEELAEGQGNLIESLEKRIEEIGEMIPELEERFVRDKWELKERIEKLEAHLGEDDDDTPRWLKGKTIHEQINQVNKDSTDDCENLRGNSIQSSELLGISLTEMNTKIKELQNINNKKAVSSSSNVKPVSVSDVVEIVKDLDRRLRKLEEEFKSQLKSIWHDGVRGTRGQASLRGLNERLNGAEIALEKLEKGLSDSNAITKDVEQRIIEDIDSLRKLMLANMDSVTEH